MVFLGFAEIHNYAFVKIVSQISMCWLLFGNCVMESKQLFDAHQYAMQFLEEYGILLFCGIKLSLLFDWKAMLPSIADSLFSC